MNFFSIIKYFLKTFNTENNLNLCFFLQFQRIQILDDILDDILVNKLYMS